MVMGMKMVLGNGWSWKQDGRQLLVFRIESNLSLLKIERQYKVVIYKQG